MALGYTRPAVQLWEVAKLLELVMIRCLTRAWFGSPTWPFFPKQRPHSLT